MVSCRIPAAQMLKQHFRSIGSLDNLQIGNERIGAVIQPHVRTLGNDMVMPRLAMGNYVYALVRLSLRNSRWQFVNTDAASHRLAPHNW